GDAGGDAQLDLRIVRLDQHAALGGTEAPPIAFVAGQVLQVGRGAAHAAGDAPQLSPVGVDTSVFGDVLQPVPAVGGDTLARGPALPDQRGKRVVDCSEGIVLGGLQGDADLRERLLDLFGTVPVPCRRGGEISRPGWGNRV